MDPLLLLREFILTGREVRLEESDGGRYLRMGSNRYPIDISTRFKQKGGSAGYYSLGAIWFLYENRVQADKMFSKYFLEAGSKGFGKVSLVDKKDVLDFLAGAKDIPDEIMTAAGEQPGVGEKRKADDAMDVDEDEIRRGKQMMHEHLFGQKAKAPPAVELEGLSSEEIAGIVAKRKAKMDADEVVSKPPQEVSAYVRLDERLVRDIKMRERLLADRNSVLDLYRRKDFSFVLDDVHAIKVLETHAAQTAPQRPVPLDPRQVDITSVAGPDDTFLQDLDPRGSFASIMSGEPARPRSPVRRPDPPARPTVRSEPAPAATARPANPVRPIILVPPGSGIVNLANVQELLENGRYVSCETGAERPTEVRIRRRMDKDLSVSYDVYDNPARLRPEDWDRVACVIAKGTAWQFKNYKYPDVAVLFDKVLGVYFHFDGDVIDPAVTKWNVKRLPINKHERHKDPSVCLNFWKLVDQHLQANNAKLLPKARPTAHTKRP